MVLDPSKFGYNADDVLHQDLSILFDEASRQSILDCINGHGDSHCGMCS